MKRQRIDGYIQVGDLVEIHSYFVSIAGCRFGLVIKNYQVVPPPSTTLKRSMADILKPDGSIGRIPFSFVKKVHRSEVNNER